MRIRSGEWMVAPALLAALTLAGPVAATEEGMPEVPDAALAERAAPAPSAPEATTMDSGEVARAAFTTLVAGREPQDDIESLSNEHNRIIFFTDLRGLSGQSVTHVWERDGAVMARVPFAVSGDRWRVYSTKNLEPSWTGEWTVKVVDANGKVLHSQSFSYVSMSADATGEATGDATPPASIPMD